MLKPLGEYDGRLATMLATMDAHIKADAVAFSDVLTEIKQLNQDVKTLLTARTFARAAWWTLGTVSVIIVTLAGLYLTYIKH